MKIKDGANCVFYKPCATYEYGKCHALKKTYCFSDGYKCPFWKSADIYKPVYKGAEGYTGIEKRGVDNVKVY